MQNYNRRVNFAEHNELTMAMSDYISAMDKDRLDKYTRHWNFYEGFHWEDISEFYDKPMITKNYCRPFVDKFVAFEFSSGATITSPSEEDNDEGTVPVITNFLDDIWNTHNNLLRYCTEMGQTKSVTGDSWTQVKYESPEEINDPFGEYPQGRIRVINMPTHFCFPEWDSHDKDKLVRFTVMYPVKELDKSLVFKKPTIKTKLYKTIWTDEEVSVQLGKEEPQITKNPYGVIPFVHIPNYPLANKTVGQSDLDDIIPLNVELNLKSSDVSEIIDYHSAPVTVVYGANINSLEKGANKMWGGLPKDAKVENLTMNTDLEATTTYIESTKRAIHEIGCVPQNALGDINAISNTSGVALQIMHMPLIERTRIKRLSTIEGMKKINKLILLMGLQNDMITTPENLTPKEFYNTEIVFQDPLPKDKLIELQQIEAEMRLGLESRHGAMNRIGKDSKKVKEFLDGDYKDHPEFYGHQDKQFNSGMMNGETPQELMNKEINGENKETKESKVANSK